MKILILNWRDVRHPKSGGAELVTMEHAKGWVKAGHRVTWLTASYPGAKHESIVEGVHFVRRWGSLTVYLYAPIYLLLNARLVDVIVDEVHGFPFFSPLFTRTPVVVFIHEIAGEIWDFMFSFPKNIIGKMLERTYFQLYKHCLFWTDAQSTIDELVERGIPKAQCVAIPCPIINPIAVKQKKEQDPTFIFVSRVVRMKGIEEIIKAFSFIVRVQHNAKLWIVGSGDGTYIEILKKMLGEYGVKATFFGEVSQKIKYTLMARAHLLLHASVKEGWGLVVLEAAHSGTPAIVYNVAGLKDVVHHQKTGIVIWDNSPKSLAQESLQLIADSARYKKMQTAAKNWQHSLSWPKVYTKSLELLTRAVYNDRLL